MRDWSDAVVEEEEKEEQQHRGYYTDSVVQGGQPRRGGQGRGGRARYTGNYQHPMRKDREPAPDVQHGRERRRLTDDEDTILDTQDISSVTSQDQDSTSSFDGHKGPSNRRRRRNKRPRNMKKPPNAVPNSETETDGGASASKTSNSRTAQNDSPPCGEADRASTRRNSDDREKTPTMNQKLLNDAQNDGTNSNTNASKSTTQVNGTSQDSTRMQSGGQETAKSSGKIHKGQEKVTGSGKTTSSQK